MTYTEATRHLQKGPFAPVYLVSGESPYLIRKIIAHFRDLVDPATRDFNTDVVWGAEAHPAEVVEMAQTLPMMAKRRLVLIRDADQMKNPEAFVPYLQRPCPTTVLVFVAAKPDLRRTLFAALQKSATVIACPPPGPNELTGWIAREGAALGLSVSGEAMTFLQEHLGRDLDCMAQMLAMLALADLPAGEVSLSAARRMASGGREHTVFEWVDFLADRNTQRALSCLHALLSEGTAPLKILAMMLWQWRRMATAQRIIHDGGSESSAAKAAGLHPFQVGVFFRRLKKWRADEIRNAFDLAFKADSQLKGGPIPASFVLETMILAMCRGAGEAGG